MINLFHAVDPADIKLLRDEDRAVLNKYLAPFLWHPDRHLNKEELGLKIGEVIETAKKAREEETLKRREEQDNRLAEPLRLHKALLGELLELPQGNAPLSDEGTAAQVAFEERIENNNLKLLTLKRLFEEQNRQD